MQFGVSEAALLFSLLLAGYGLRPVGDFAFGLSGHWFAGLLIWGLLILILFLPALLVATLTDCENRAAIAVFGLFGGALVYKSIAWHRRRRGNAF